MFRAAESIHPSEFVLEEMAARGWTLDDLAIHMGGDLAVNRLCMELYCEIGPTDRNLLLGAQTSSQLGKAFGTSPGLFLRLHRVWHEWSVFNQKMGGDSE
jgi:plasmid maintenance system antidote protein VapI